MKRVPSGDRLPSAKASRAGPAGRPCLGDIAGFRPLLSSANVPLEAFSPLQRVVLSANGNLQRLISSFYNLPVTVTCVRNEPLAERVYSREVSELSLARETLAL